MRSLVESFRDKLGGRILIRADFSGANLSEADLLRKKLRGADLRGADLGHADLHSVENLTKEQIASACADPKNPVGLPKGWEQPPSCRRSEFDLIRPPRAPQPRGAGS